MSLVPCLFPTIICTWHPITFRSDGEWYGDLRHLGRRCPGRNRLSRCRRALLCVLLQDFFSPSKMDFSRGEDLVVFLLAAPDVDEELEGGENSHFRNDMCRRACCPEKTPS